MSLIRQDNFGQFWFGYVHGDETLWRWERSDTDMGDLSTHELEDARGPLKTLTDSQFKELLMQREVSVSLVKIKRSYGKQGLKFAYDKLEEYKEKIGF